MSSILINLMSTHDLQDMTNPIDGVGEADRQDMSGVVARSAADLLGASLTARATGSEPGDQTIGSREPAGDADRSGESRPRLGGSTGPVYSGPTNRSSNPRPAGRGVPHGRPPPGSESPPSPVETPPGSNRVSPGVIEDADRFDVPAAVLAGDPGWARTNDLPLRRRLLYPAELRSLGARRPQKPRVPSGVKDSSRRAKRRARARP